MDAERNPNKLPQPEERLCLVTVTSAGYIQWTLTMIYSFRMSNSWFTGDIIIIAGDLNDEEKSMFSIFPEISLITPSIDLTERIAELCRQMPVFLRMASMFHSLELFNLRGYSKILFLDSDMLVVKPVKEVFERKELFCASAESCWYQGKGRRADTYDAVENFHDPSMFIKSPVNSGFMLIQEQLINPGNYNSLVNMIQPSLWANKSTYHADQLIINLFFRDRITRLDAGFNYRPVNAAAIKAKDGIALEDALIIHYFRQYKPWNFNEVLELSTSDMVHLKAFRLWYASYTNLLKYNHLKQKIKEFKKDDPNNP